MMLRKRNFAAAMTLTPVALGLAPLATRAASSYVDSVSGFEIAATPTEGRFVGSASGSQRGGWYIDVVHQPLSRTAPVAITGGSVNLATVLQGQPVVVTGSFSSGSVDQTGGFGGCSNQTFAVSGVLVRVGLVGAAQAVGGGSFNATLTHYQTEFFGRCVTYSASVTGAVSLTY